MNLEHIKKAALVYFRSNIPLFLFGVHGIGKTSIFYQMYLSICQSRGQNMTELVNVIRPRAGSNVVNAHTGGESISSLEGRHLARVYGDEDSFRFWSMNAPTITIEELIGMPHVVDERKEFSDVYMRCLDVAATLIAGRNVSDDDMPDAVFALHTRMLERVARDLGLKPRERQQLTLTYLRMYGIIPDPNHRGGGIWLADELNRAFNEVQTAVMQMLLERRYLDYVVPDGVWMATTMNPAGGGYRVRDMDEAILDRAAVLVSRSSKDELMSYARSRGFAEHTRVFIDKHDRLINAHEQEYDLNIKLSTTSRSVELSDRAWSNMVDDEIKEVGATVITGLIGLEAAALYYQAAMDRSSQPLSVEDVIDCYGCPSGDVEDVINDFESWPLTNARKRLLAMVDGENVKTELVNVTLENVSEWLDKVNERYVAVDARTDDRGGAHVSTADRVQLLNVLRFLTDVPADVSRQFLLDKLHGKYGRLFFWAGKYKIAQYLHKRIEGDYRNAERGEAA